MDKVIIIMLEVCKRTTFCCFVVLILYFILEVLHVFSMLESQVIWQLEFKL